MVTVVHERDKQNPWASIAERGVSNAIKGVTERSDEMALKRAVENLGENADPREVLKALVGTTTYGKGVKEQAIKNYMGIEQFEEVRRHAKKQEEIAREKNEIAKQKLNDNQNKDLLKQSLISDGMPDYEADLFVNAPKSVQDRVIAGHQEAKARGLRQPQGQLPQPQGQQVQGIPEQPPQIQQPQPTPQAPPPIQGEVGQEIPSPQETEKVLDSLTPKKDEWPKIDPPPATTYAEKEKWRTSNQTFNNKELKEVRNKLKGRTDSLIRYNRLSNLNNSNKLPSDMGKLIINPSTGEPYAIASLAGFVNKETQDYVKTMNDFLAHAKDFFGARVTNFDVQAFKSRLPSLLNTQDGRRLITEQMKLMEELQIVHEEELEKGLKHYGRNASYSEITNIVDSKIEAKQQAVLNKIDNLDKASEMMDVMQKDPNLKNRTLMQSPKGQWKAVPNDQVNEAKGKQWIKW